MNEISRRRLIKTGVVAAGSLTGLAAAGRIAKRYGLVPPDHGGCYGAGETLTYATQRLLTGSHAVREFPRNMISKAPFANEVDSAYGDEFKKLQAGGFRDWRLVVDGMVDHPLSLSLADLRSMPHAQPDHGNRVRGRLDLHRRVDRDAASRSAEGGRPAPQRAVYLLPIDGQDGLVGEHRYGRCDAPANVADNGDERWGTSCWIRRPAPYARCRANSATRA